MKRQTILGALFALCATTSMSLAQPGMVHLSIPRDTPAPLYYARIGADSTGTEIYHDDTWAAIVFYCNPEDIPDGFNLLGFYATDPVEIPMTVSGFILWDPEALAAMEAPRLINLHGDGAVPVWFVSWPELQRAIADGILTVQELAGLAPIKKGTATVYNEELLPLKHITIDAEGRLEDGRRFQFHVSLTGVPPADCCSGRQVRIRIW
jgi:hypothetical protein